MNDSKNTKPPVFSDFDREVIARLPITPKQREELIKSMAQKANLAVTQSPAKSMSSTSTSQVSVKVVSKPSVGATSHVNV